MKITLLGEVVPDAHELAAIMNAVPDGVDVSEITVQATGTTVRRPVKVVERAPWGGAVRQVGTEYVQEPVFAVGLNVGRTAIPIERVPMGGGRITIEVREG